MSWNAFWYQPVPPHRIAAFRIALGVYLMFFWAQYAPHVEVLFSRDGVYVPYLIGDYAPAVWAAWAMFGVLLVLTLLFTVGLWTHWVTPLLLCAFLYHYFLQLAVKHSSFERLMLIYLLILCLADSSRVWALDARGKPATAVPIWAERLIRFQTIMLYLGSGLWKAFNPAWQDGKLLWATLQGMWATPLAFEIVRWDLSEASWHTITWIVIGFELVLAPLFYFRRTRNLACIMGVAFHLANSTILAVPEFMVAVTPYVLFLQVTPLQRRLEDASD